MNAQQRWKKLYNFSRIARAKGLNGLAEDHMLDADRYIREAALERALEAEKRMSDRYMRSYNQIMSINETLLSENEKARTAVIQLAQAPFPLHDYCDRDVWETACSWVEMSLA